MTTPEEVVQDLRMRVQHLEAVYEAALDTHNEVVGELREGYERLEEIRDAAHAALDRERLLVPQEIRDELVCCDIYERMEGLVPRTEAYRKLRFSHDYHAICYYGEWAARIAEKAVKR